MSHSKCSHHGCSCTFSFVSNIPFHHSKKLKTKKHIDTVGKTFADFSKKAQYFVFDKIYTLEADKPIAKAVKVKGQNIAEVYTEKEWNDFRSHTLKGKSINDKQIHNHQGYLYPGFYESHMHPLLDGLLKNSGIDVRDISDASSLIQALNERLAYQLENKLNMNGKYLTIGYNVDPLSQVEPSKDTWLQSLDQVKSDGVKDEDLYVLVEHNSMHIWYVNNNLYNAILKSNPKLTPETDPDFYSYFPHTSDGQPTGVVQEDTGIQALIKTLIEMKLMNTNPEFIIHSARSIAKEAQSQGCTTMTEAMLGSITGDLDVYLAVTNDLNSIESFPVRVVAHPFFESDFAKNKMQDNPRNKKHQYNQRFGLGGIKYVVDGSLQGGTAYKAGYEKVTFDKFFNSPIDGVLNASQAALEMALSSYRDFQPMIHANSTEAIQITIDALTSVFSDQELKALGPRIEHCQIPTKKQLKTMALKGIKANFLVNHVYYWGNIYTEELLKGNIGNKISPMKKAIDEGLEPALHSDSYVSPLSPLRLIWTAVNRYAKAYGDFPQKVIAPKQCVSVEEALKGVTINAAKLDSMEHLKGSIRKNKLADFTHLSVDLFEIDKDDIINAPIKGTVLGGHYLKNPKFSSQKKIFKNSQT